ncbi:MULTISPECIES: BlaI/MecI/CopY family transcriptional regulator [unclassified Duganella]|uniref:BlaI/MecI/CopY family transcriptional regulator n=1 Tax=unclassified Duganella TaxID=2636909 RepID=UPI000E343063|nr:MULTISPECIES: BlaI/MecI/CopY family transcriptional regulator [unclassified Duganella]RFP19374.1 BlaI/MecI/CopY family transcriptional regulator [Duganella sp. BJB475]RFP35955.1 BlaI/MecI/CopY family transcriptional regulator [Duganella sp. BJB476]
MKAIPQISEAESVVMEALWAHSPRSAEEVAAAIGDERAWQESTVKTLLNRLLRKNAVKVLKDGRRYLYSAAITREQWLHSESKGFLDRLFDGRVAPLVAHFSRHRKLSKADLEELKRLIGELDDGN